MVKMDKNSTATRKFLGLLSSTLRHVDDILRPKAPMTGSGHKKNFLFLSYSPALGTSINETVVFEAMKAAFPSCRIAVCASGVPYQVIQNNPNVDYAWDTVDAATDALRAVRQIRCLLRRHNFQPDYICTDSSNSRSKIVLIGYLIAPAYRAGFAIHSGLLHRSLKYDSRLSLIDNNLQIPSLFGGITAHYEPRIFFSQRDLLCARELLGDVENSPPLAVMVTQGSGTAPTAWFEPRFAEVADFLHETLGFRVVFVGSKVNAPAIDRIQKLMRAPSLSLAGRTSISEMAAILSLCDIGVGIDTGGMHVARSVKLPFVLLAQAMEEPHVWLPLNQPQFEILRRNDIGCRNCGKKVCATRECMEEIRVVQVTAAIRKLLERYPPATESRLGRASLCLSKN
jgi:ADP-heptose:LPS heptosyltransferase